MQTEAIQIQPLAGILLEKINAQLEREAFMEYVEAVADKVSLGAPEHEARTTCPREYAAWRSAFRKAYRGHPQDEVGVDV